MQITLFELWALTTTFKRLCVLVVLLAFTTGKSSYACTHILWVHNMFGGFRYHQSPWLNWLVYYLPFKSFKSGKCCCFSALWTQKILKGYLLWYSHRKWQRVYSQANTYLLFIWYQQKLGSRIKSQGWFKLLNYVQTAYLSAIYISYIEICF